MKTKNLIASALCITAINASAYAGDSPGNRITVHEWGTFTSVQGAEGELLEWKPLETPELPKFVYDWKRPAPGRRATGPYAPFTKGGFVTLQRMETPVIYFYTDKEQSVDLSVDFPSGFITEWFPQAQQMGPSTKSTNPVVMPAGFGDGVTFSPKSMIRWQNLHLYPAGGNAGLKTQLPADPTGNRYFTARETDSTYLRSATLTGDKNPFDYEKFLFYRGVGSFTTPLRVKLESENTVTLINDTTNVVPSLFVLRIKDKAGSFTEVRDLKSGSPKHIELSRQGGGLPLEKLQRQLGDEMAAALTESGLYPPEARAMVNTWMDSWFQGEGMRVLYLLPRKWTDATLPLTVNPPPAQLVRVMVGRAEVLTPDMENMLCQLLENAKDGDPVAGKALESKLRDLGRFAEPAFYRACARIQPGVGERKTLVALLEDTRKPL